MLARCLVLLFLLCALPASAAPVADQPHTRVELIAETRHPQPGQAFTVGVVLTPRPGWHTYWVQPGDAGMAPQPRWALPAGARAGPFHFPTPDMFVVAGIMNHVFKQPATLLADIRLPAGISGPVPVGLQLDWLVCNDRLCVPESAILDLSLVAGNGATDPAVAPRFKAARAALPQPAPAGARFAIADGRVRIEVPITDAAAVRSAHFFPYADDEILFAAPQRVTRTDAALILDTAAVNGARPETLRGVLRVEGPAGARGYRVEAAPGAVAAGRPLAAPAGASAFLPAFLLAVLGGLLLNLMPCVFPILSLKALSLARAGESAAEARREGLAYTAGVLLACTLLGAVVLALVRAGAGAGWAFQLQDPRVTLLLLLLTLAIGLNLAGLYELPALGASSGQKLAARSGPAGAFWTGVLAAFIATPCTGPFMAGALGAALLLPPAAGLGVFAGLGLGLALPFLAVGFVPPLRRLLPRPGPWMLTFRRILSLPMLLTAAGLGWVLMRQAGTSALGLGVGAALVVGLGLWWLGWRQWRRYSWGAPIGLVLVATAAAPLTLARLPAPAPVVRTPAGGLPFDRAELDRLRAAHVPVFLYFTADWCLTCKVNEQGALSDTGVEEAFARAGIRTMVGDWTRPDPEIARFLADHGRAGIPYYVFHGRDGRSIELPQLLTAARLRALAANPDGEEK